MTHFIRSSILYKYILLRSKPISFKESQIKLQQRQLHKLRMTYSQFLYKLSVQIELIQFLKTNTYLPVMGVWTIILTVSLPFVTLIQVFLHRTILSFEVHKNSSDLFDSTNAFVSLVKSWRLDKYNDDITMDF